MQTLKIISTKALQLVAPMCGKTVSKTLHVDALIQALKTDFGKLTDDDAIMSAFAMFHLKDQALQICFTHPQENSKEPSTHYVGAPGAHNWN